MTQEFHISVTQVGQSDYLVRTEQVAPGVPLAEELVTWPVTEWLTQTGHLMNDPLNSMLRFDALAPNSATNLVSLGQQLYNSLFQGTLRDSWITAQGIAQNQQQALRLRLGIKDPRLARLPWEVMHAADRPLATGPFVAFSRYQSGLQVGSRLPSSAMPTPPFDGCVRVLMAIASPADLVSLDLLKHEAVKLKAELQRRLPTQNSHAPEIHLTLLEQPGREELTQALEQGRYHVLHYSGHSNYGPNGGEIYLVSSRTGLTETLSGDDLAGLLVNNGIQMAVFNSCLGAFSPTTSTNDTGERNLAESLVKRGIQSVLAMSERIPDEVALTLTQLFYRNLRQGYPVDLCVSRVRQGLISAYGSGQMYWALPILYLQPEFDGSFIPEMQLPQTAELFNDYEERLVSPSYSHHSSQEVPLPIEGMMPDGFDDSSDEIDWLGKDDWDNLVDEIEYDDPNYEADSAIVSDLFRQLDQHRVESDIPAKANAPEEQLTLRNPAVPRAQELVETPTPPLDLDRTPPANRRKLLTIVGIVSASALAIAIGLGWQRQQQLSQGESLPLIPVASVPAVPDSDAPVNLRTSDTQSVTALALENFNKGNVNAGLRAVEELLNRNALKNAKTSLDAVPLSKADAPEVNFLKGRLAWQSIQIKDKNYGVDDARRYWETAVKGKPDSPVYQNALGFAYYAENDPNRANQSWFQALFLIEQQQAKNTSTVVSSDALTAYAGLALVFNKLAPSQPPEKQERLANQAIKLRQMVLRDNSADFQPESLAKNWMWTDSAISDWRQLLSSKK